MIYNNVDEICDAIEAQRSKLIARVETLNDEQIAKRETADGWTVGEIFEHVGIVETAINGFVEKLLARAESEGLVSDGTFDPPISFAEQDRITAGQKFTAPEHIRPTGSATIGQSAAALRANAEKIDALRPRLKATDLSKSVAPHPAFGRLNLYQWLILTCLHEQRHLAQIERALAK